LEKLVVGQYVKFVGAKFGKDKYNFLRKAKILVTYPKTSNDAFPTVFLEAWANLVPIISSNIGPIPHIIEEGKNGFVCQLDEKEIAKNIMKGLKNRNKIKQTCTNSVKLYELE
jgi:glycosyltransferase involved in cell wall biosynthesis